MYKVLFGNSQFIKYNSKPLIHIYTFIHLFGKIHKTKFL